MISPELLRRYHFFSSLNSEQLKQVAMVADEETIAAGQIILEEGKTAQYIYILIEGGIEVYFMIQEGKDFFVTEINPGDLFGISALVEPFLATTSVRTSKPSRVIKISATALRDACTQDKELAVAVYQQIAKIAIERLNSTRIQLVAAR